MILLTKCHSNKFNIKPNSCCIPVCLLQHSGCKSLEEAYTFEKYLFRSRGRMIFSSTCVWSWPATLRICMWGLTSCTWVSVTIGDMGHPLDGYLNIWYVRTLRCQDKLSLGNSSPKAWAHNSLKDILLISWFLGNWKIMSKSSHHWFT